MSPIKLVFPVFLVCGPTGDLLIFTFGLECIWEAGLATLVGECCYSLLELLWMVFDSFVCFMARVLPDFGLLKLTSRELIFRVWPGCPPPFCLMVTF